MEITLYSSATSISLKPNRIYDIKYCRLLTPVPPNLVQLTINCVFDVNPYTATEKAVETIINFRPYGEECYKTYQVVNRRITADHQFYKCRATAKDGSGEITIPRDFDFILGFDTTDVVGPTESSSLLEKKSNCLIT
nr:hypothetical protein K-LCC10_0371 [Kaumoebavirus]